MFFSAHGYWPEAAAVSGREERSFITHGLKTTVILEPSAESRRSRIVLLYVEEHGSSLGRRDCLSHPRRICIHSFAWLPPRTNEAYGTDDAQFHHAFPENHIILEPEVLNDD
jgi:hypothetical protein